MTFKTSISRRGFIGAQIALASTVMLPKWGQATQWPEKIRIGAVASSAGKPFATGLTGVAHVKQFIEAEFKDTPVKVEWVYFSGGGPAINEAIANEQLEFAQAGILPTLLGHSRGLPTRSVVSYGGVSVFAVVRKGLDVKDISGLKGRKIAVLKGTMMHWALLEAFALYGLSTADVTIVDLKGVDQLPALVAGSVDAAFSASELLPLEEQGFVTTIYSSRGRSPKLAGQGNYVATQPFLDKHPEAATRVVRGLLNAAQWLAQPENLKENYEIWAKSGVSTKILEAELEGVDLKSFINPRLDSFYYGRVKAGIEFAKAEKLIRKDIDVDGFVEPRFYKQAIAELGFETFWPDRDADGNAV